MRNLIRKSTTSLSRPNLNPTSKIIPYTSKQSQTTLANATNNSNHPCTKNSTIARYHHHNHTPSTSTSNRYYNTNSTTLPTIPKYIPSRQIKSNPNININNVNNKTNIPQSSFKFHTSPSLNEISIPKPMAYPEKPGALPQDIERLKLLPSPEERVKTLFGDIDPDDLVEVSVNDIKVNVPSGVTVLQACEAAGINIPRFCYHDRLSIAGNCRMCLVEVEKAKKPIASCANPIMPGMNIRTDTEMVKFAREGVVEFLLANHPLDCPICDQGGECDLQDISGTFGSLSGRYKEIRRPVEDKDIGPFVKTVMTRCIHCTRCIRFADEIAGNEMLGTTGRGNATEIGTYIESYFDSELSGNVIDLCPVGALTNRTSAFKVRTWDLTVIESIDVLESTCANIVLDTRFNELIRVKPRLNEDVNEEWISDKTRFVVDGLKRQRLDLPLIKDNVTGQLMPATWPEAMNAVADAISDNVNDASQDMKAIAGDLCDVESMLALKDLFNNLGCNNTECRQDNTKILCDIRSDYLFNTTMSGMEFSDLCLLIGTNPRMEAPLINAKLRKCYLNGLDIFLIGHDAYLNYPKEILGNNLSTLQEIASGNHPFCERLASAEHPMLIFGLSTLEGEYYNVTMSLINSLLDKYPNLISRENDWNGINILQTRSSKNGSFDIGFVPGPDVSSLNANDLSNIKFLYLLGSDEINISNIPNNTFVVYQGSHGDRSARRADIILPGCSYVEKNGTFVNIDGRVQRTKAALTPPGQARTDWQVIRALSEVVGTPLNYDNINELRDRLYDIAPHFKKLDEIEYGTWKNEIIGNNNQLLENENAIVDTNVLNEPFNKYFDNYFATDHISRSSVSLQHGARDLTYSANSWVE